MRDQELHTFHSFYLEIAKEFEVDLEEYENFSVYPHFVHKHNDDHKEAIQILSKIVGEEIGSNGLQSWKTVNTEESDFEFGEWEWYHNRENRDVVIHSPTETRIDIYRNAGTDYKWMVLDEWSGGKKLSQAIDLVYTDPSKISSTTPYRQMFTGIGEKLNDSEQRNLGMLVDRYMNENGIKELEKPYYLE